LRPDVARHFDNDGLSTSGFEAIVTTGRLAPGDHEIVAYTVDAQQRRYARVAQTLHFTIVADWTSLPADAPRRDTVCSGSLDRIVDESRGLTLTPNAGVVAVPRGSLLSLAGWFYDPSTTETITRAYAVVDGERAFPVAYGEPRLDVAAQVGRAMPAEVGFSVSIPTVTLKRGMHSVEMFALAADGATLIATPINLQIIVGQSSSARLPLAEMTLAFLDDVVRVQRGPAREVGAPLRILRGDRLFVRGWAVDEPARNVAAGVVIVIDGKIEVPALYGLPRPDVAEVHGNDAFLRSGFSGEIETDDLAAGLHTAECRVLSRDGRGAYLTAQRFEFELNEV
jgi:hypothetical protein